MTPSISVIVPTYRRPGSLAAAVRSVLAQRGFAPGEVELVVVDNDPRGSARDTFEALAAGAPMPMAYVLARAPGVAQARNAGVGRAGGGLIAFLDDDETAPPHWLAALVATQAETGADAVFGPVRAELPTSVEQHREYLARFFSRTGPAAAGVIEDYYGCGNSLVARSALPNPAKPFSGARDHTGGEDDLLFGTMKDRGARFAWAPAAWVTEHVAESRANLGYAVRRAFAYGQGPTEACVAAGRWGGVARWMAIGAAQAVVFGLVAAAQWLLRAPGRAEALDRAARGLGKLLWFGVFRIEFYGRAASAADPAA